MAKIIAPNKQYNGVSASVPFVNGEGATKDPHLIEWFEKHGYKVINDISFGEQPVLENKEVNKEKAVCNDELGSLKKEQLQDIANRLELEFNSKTTNAELIEMIKIAKDMEE